jgi:hypothetical protein
VKTAGIIILSVGLLMTLYTGITFLTQEKVVDLNAFQITVDKPHTVNWQPYIGLGIALIGGVLLIRGNVKSKTG